MKIKVLTDSGYEVWADPNELVLPPGTSPNWEERRVLFNKDGETLKAFVKDEDVTDRMSRLDAIYYQGNVTFELSSIEDKLSGERVGDFFLVFAKGFLPPVYWGGYKSYVTGFCTIESPRRPEFDRLGLARWDFMEDGRLCICFEEWDPEVKRLQKISGTNTADDQPWNWHYGLMIRGTIAMLP